MAAIEQQHPALTHPCPFCGVDAGQHCRAHRGKGRELDRPHLRRIHINHPLRSVEPTPPRQALCCECGHLRTVSGNYSFRRNDANRSYGESFDDHRGWRSTGTLLCTNCGKPTRHAVLRGEDDDFRDYAEKVQSYVLGGESPGEYSPDRESLRRRYFEQFPHNPELSHQFMVHEAKAAWNAGQPTITALCGAPMTLTYDPSLDDGTRAPMTELVAPDRIDWDTEFEDTATGLWWVDMQCVNCLAVANDLRLKQSRRELQAELLEMSAVIDHLSAADVASLREQLAQLMSKVNC